MIRVARFFWQDLALIWNKDKGKYIIRDHFDRLQMLLAPVKQLEEKKVLSSAPSSLIDLLPPKSVVQESDAFEDFIRQFLLFPSSSEDRKAAVKKYKRSGLIVQIINYNNENEFQTLSEFFPLTVAVATSIAQSLSMRTKQGLPKVAEVSIYLE